MQTQPSDYSHAQLVDALQNEWEYLIHDDFEEGVDMPLDEHLEYLKSLSHSQLVEECTCDDVYTLQEFIANHTYS